jgi:antitoxin CptB
MSVTAVPGRLLWRCRRGLKELDVLLERFVREHYEGAPAPERAAFEHLVDLSDPELAACLLEGAPLPEGPLTDLRRRILDNR